MAYDLTADGRDLASALRLLADWGAPALGRRRAAPPRDVRHAARGPLVLPDLRDRRRRRRRAGRARPLGRTRRSGYTRRRDHGRRTLGTGHAGPRPPGRARAPARDQPDLPPSLQGLPPRSVPEVAPTPLQKHYINLSVVVLICGAIAITALELGARARRPADQAVRARSRRRCWSSRPPTRSSGSGARPGRGCPSTPGKGWFRLAWVAVSLVGLAALVVASIAVLLA